MGVKMIWPYDRTGLSLISPDLSQNKAARRKRATERKETLTPEGFFGVLCWTNQNLGAEPLALWLGSNGEVSRRVDPCGGPRGESHCRQALMAPKIPQLTKTCERLRNERHLWFKWGFWGLHHEVCSWEKASQRKRPLPRTPEDKPTWSAFWTQFHIFIILHHKTVGFSLFYVDSATKADYLGKKMNERMNSFGRGAKGIIL